MKKLALIVSIVTFALTVALISMPIVAEAEESVCANTPTDMVCVTAGQFTMGSNLGDDDELPLHPVKISEFLLDKTEVSFGEYMACVQSGKCGLPRYHPPKPKAKSKKVIRKLPRKRRRPRRAAPRPAAPGGPQVLKIKVDTVLVDSRLPAAGITWHDAKKFCAWKGKQLPTEAQWEYAARGTKGNYYAWGSAKLTCQRANTHHCGGKPVPVKSNALGASPFGAINLTGNVWEWVEDWYDATYYDQSKGATDPIGPPNVQNPATQAWKYRHRVVRGGSWSGIPADLRTTYRYRLLPAMYASDIGFRCAKTATTPPATSARVKGLRLARKPSLLPLR